MAGGVDFQGATGASYTLTEDEEGKAIRVKVSFTDDAGNAEELTSPATEAAQPPPQSSHGAARHHRHLPGGRDPDGRHLRHFRCRRNGERILYLSVDGGRDGRPRRHRSQLQPDQRRRWEGHQRAGELRRRQGQRGELTSAPNAPVEPEPDEPDPTEPAESPPSAPRNLSISAAGTGTLALSWVEPSDPGSPGPVRYIVQWKECCWSRRRIQDGR